MPAFLETLVGYIVGCRETHSISEFVVVLVTSSAEHAG